RPAHWLHARDAPRGGARRGPVRPACGRGQDRRHSRAGARLARGRAPLRARKGVGHGGIPRHHGAALERARAGALESAIVDGEIVVVSEAGRPRPFSAIQPRLKKTTPDEALLRDYPVRFLVYDLMFE